MSAMMKVILGSALGGLAAGVLALVASAQGRSTVPADPWAMQAAAARLALPVADTRGLSTATTNTPTMVQCEPRQEALLRRAFVGGREVAEVTCVGPTGTFNGSTVADTRTAEYGESDIVTVPASRTPAARPRTVRQAAYAEPRAAASTRQAIDVKKRSWKKTALIVGAGTGAGAGIGAIAGGKKGALIGAAIGGGAASIYEVTKRR
jgi:hypothetical protein